MMPGLFRIRYCHFFTKKNVNRSYKKPIVQGFQERSTPTSQSTKIRKSRGYVQFDLS